jgi:hypothetical protein
MHEHDYSQQSAISNQQRQKQPPHKTSTHHANSIAITTANLGLSAFNVTLNS